MMDNALLHYGPIMVALALFALLGARVAYVFHGVNKHLVSEVSMLNQSLNTAENHINNLEVRAEQAERTRHELVLAARSVIEAGGLFVSNSNQLRGEHIQRVGHALPYLLSGCRDWGYLNAESTEAASNSAKRLAGEYGFALSHDPVSAVIEMMHLAMMLFEPEWSVPIETLRNRNPLHKYRALP